VGGVFDEVVGPHVVLVLRAKMTKSSARQSIAARASEFQLSVAQNDEILAVVTKLFRQEELSPQEEVRLHFFLGCLFRATEEAFLQYRDGFLDDEYWNKRGNLMLNYLRYPGMFEAWQGRLRSTYHSAFVKWVEGQFPRDAA
jgi:hypothetical protein